MRRLAPSAIFVICASTAIAFGVGTFVRAGTLPDISGTWYANGNPAYRCSISQSGSSVSLTNEQGASASGQFISPGVLATNWGASAGGHIRGHISGDLRTITWNNGTYWTRSLGSYSRTSSWSSSSTSSSSSSSVSAGYVAPPPPTPRPYRYLSYSKPDGPQPPIDYVDGWTAVMNNGTMVYSCVSFKNTGSATATRIGFFFPLSNRSGHVVDTPHFDRSGTFSPNVEIHGWHDLAEWSTGQGHHGKYDNCVRWRPDNEEERVAYTHLQHYSIVVKRIDYSDGTVWPKPASNEPTPESTATAAPTTTPRRR